MELTKSYGSGKNKAMEFSEHSNEPEQTQASHKKALLYAGHLSQIIFLQKYVHIIYYRKPFPIELPIRFWIIEDN
jgi:hypothetical protein